ncbi:extensin-like [Morone saxatilis]|uniref:extensin-like n=1 Tax=Morone saxatilis TaxID=34816 RepID=UPI0015E1F3A1|nr:extensin-like [Morone saxatilis]
MGAGCGESSPNSLSSRSEGARSQSALGSLTPHFNPTITTPGPPYNISLPLLSHLHLRLPFSFLFPSSPRLDSPPSAACVSLRRHAGSALTSTAHTPCPRPAFSSLRTLSSSQIVLASLLHSFAPPPFSGPPLLRPASLFRLHAPPCADSAPSPCILFSPCPLPILLPPPLPFAHPRTPHSSRPLSLHPTFLSPVATLYRCRLGSPPHSSHRRLSPIHHLCPSVHHPFFHHSLSFIPSRLSLPPHFHDPPSRVFVPYGCALPPILSLSQPRPPFSFLSTAHTPRILTFRVPVYGTLPVIYPWPLGTPEYSPHFPHSHRSSTLPPFFDFLPRSTPHHPVAHAALGVLPCLSVPLAIPSNHSAITPLQPATPTTPPTRPTYLSLPPPPHHTTLPPPPHPPHRAEANTNHPHATTARALLNLSPPTLASPPLRLLTPPSPPPAFHPTPPLPYFFASSPPAPLSIPPPPPHGSHSLAAHPSHLCFLSCLSQPLPLPHRSTHLCIVRPHFCMSRLTRTPPASSFAPLRPTGRAHPGPHSHPHPPPSVPVKRGPIPPVTKTSISPPPSAPPPPLQSTLSPHPNRRRLPHRNRPTHHPPHPPSRLTQASALHLPPPPLTPTHHHPTPHPPRPLKPAPLRPHPTSAPARPHHTRTQQQTTDTNTHNNSLSSARPLTPLATQLRP